MFLLCLRIICFFIFCLSLKEKAEEKRKEMKQFVAVRVTETNPEDGAGVFSKDQAPPLSEAACEQRKNSPAKNIVPSQPSTVVSKFPEQESVANATDAATSWLQNAKAEYASCNKDQSISSSVSFVIYEFVKCGSHFCLKCFTQNMLYTIKFKTKGNDRVPNVIIYRIIKTIQLYMMILNNSQRKSCYNFIYQSAFWVLWTL